MTIKKKKKTELKTPDLKINNELMYISLYIFKKKKKKVHVQWLTHDCMLKKKYCQP